MGTLQKRGKKIEEVRGMEDISRIWPTESTKQSSHRLTEPETASVGLTWVSLGPLRICYGSYLGVFL